jgi:hypothetical protein
MIEPIGYKLNPKKLKKAPQYITPYLFLGAFYYTEDYEYFDVIKPYLDIPEKPKTLEEISQEFDEKIDKQIEDVEYKFAQLKYYQEYQFSKKITKIIEDIEYAKEHGQFPVKLTVGDLCCSNVGISSTVDWSTEFRIGKDEVGYWDIKPNIKVYLKKKPNRVVRYFTKLLLDFTWKDV